MAASKPKAPAHRTAADTSAAVEEFLRALEHPRKKEIEELRRILLAADPAIAEGVKWNAPSFRTTEYFATFHLRAKAGIAVILHLGAKVRDNSTAGAAIDDPEQLLQWLAKERAMVTFGGLDDVRAKRAAFTAIVRQWIRRV